MSDLADNPVRGTSGVISQIPIRLDGGRAEVHTEQNERSSRSWPSETTRLKPHSCCKLKKRFNTHICLGPKKTHTQSKRSLDSVRMDSLMSLGAPLKQFTSCVSGKSSPNKRVAKRSESVRRSSFSRRSSISRRRSLPCSSQKVPDSWLRVYQVELKRERKRQQAIIAKKNAERAVKGTHFRSHHCLPRQSTTTRRSAPAKDNSFFGAFQGLSLDGRMGGAHAAPAPGGEQCSVM